VSPFVHTILPGNCSSDVGRSNSGGISTTNRKLFPMLNAGRTPATAGHRPHSKSGYVHVVINIDGRQKNAKVSHAKRLTSQSRQVSRYVQMKAADRPPLAVRALKFQLFLSRTTSGNKR